MQYPSSSIRKGKLAAASAATPAVRQRLKPLVFVPIDEFLSRYTREALAHGISKGIGKFNLRGTGLPAWVGIVGLVETAQLRTLTLGLSCQFVFVRVPVLGGIITNGERTTQVRKGRILFQTSSNRDRSADA